VLHCEWFNSVLCDRQGQVVSILSFVQDVTEQHDTRAALESSQLELHRLNAELQARASEAMRESELRHGHLAEYATDMISCHTLEGQYLYASQASEALLGFRPEELVGRLAFDMFHPDDLEMIRHGHEQMLRNAGSWVVTYRLRHKQGGYVWVETTSRVIEVGDPSKPKQIVAVSRNVTERQNAEVALRESELRYRHLAEHATAMISLHDSQGCFTYLSPACQRLLGYHADELVGKMPRAIAHPDDRAAVINDMVRLRATSGADVVLSTFRARHKDGHYVWLESVSRNDGQEIVVVWRDISGRLDTEQRLRLVQSAVDQVQESVVITDTKLEHPGPHIVYVNPAFTAMSGYQPDEVYGLSPRVLQGAQTDRAVIDRLRSTLRRGESFTGQTTNYRKDGSTYVVELNINPLRDVDGRIVNWVAIQRDVTARHEAEGLKRAHREELAHVTRLSTMGEMASGLAHEINQPLTAISNYMNGGLQRVREDRISKQDLLAMMGRVADQAERAGQIIRRLRAFVSKRGTHRMRHQINFLVHDTVALLEANLKENQTTVQYDLAPNLPSLYVDGIQIEQVLLNLLRNAMDAMSDVEPQKRRVTLKTHLDKDGQVHVGVFDVGTGLSEAQLDHLFDPFFTTKENGMGMGLTISHSIVEAHGGRLWASANSPRGSHFHIVLPVEVGSQDRSKIAGEEV